MVWLFLLIERRIFFWGVRFIFEMFFWWVKGSVYDLLLIRLKIVILLLIGEKRWVLLGLNSRLFW